MRPTPFIFFAVVLSIVLSSLLPMFNRADKLKPPPTVGPLPAYSLIDSSNQPVNEELFKEHIRVYSFFFTSCSDVCPRITAAIKELMLKNADVNFVSVSVDPSTDTPSHLSEYAVKLQARPDRWRFLTGEAQAIRQLATDLKIYGDDAPGSHSTRLVLIDRHGLVRATYQVLNGEGAIDEDAISQISNDIQVLRSL